MNFSPTINNRRATYEFEPLEVFTAGIVLTGTEVKSVRLGKVQMQDAFCTFERDGLYIRNLSISPYEQGTYNNHDPKRLRKLLLTAKEIKKLKNKVSEKGLTIVPLSMFFSERGLVKLEIALARGKKTYDKRQSIKERDVKRELERN